MTETFESTFGFSSKAGEIVFKELEGNDRRAFFGAVKRYDRELSNTDSVFVCLLLKRHFQGVCKERGGKYASFKMNVISAMHRLKLEKLKK